MTFRILVYWTAAEIIASLLRRLAPYALVAWALYGAPLWACTLAALVAFRWGWRVRERIAWRRAR